MARRAKSPLVTKKHMARLEREQLQTRMIVWTTLTIVILVVGLIGYGLLNEFVLKPNRAVVRVGEDKASVKQFVNISRFNGQQIVNSYIQNVQIAQMLGYDQSYIDSIVQQITSSLEPNTLGNNVLNSIIEDLLIRQEAERRGITVSKEELEKEMQAQFGFFPDGTPTPKPTFNSVPTSTLSPLQTALFPPTSTAVITPTATLTITLTPTAIPPTATATLEPTNTPQATSTPASTATPTLSPTPYTEELFKEQYNTVIDDYETADVPESTIRWIVEGGLYRQKVRDAILAELDLKPEAEKVWARHILVADVEMANQIYEQLKNGANFADLAAQKSTDTGTASNGGDLSWFGRGEMVPDFETTAFSLGIGEISQPVQTTFGWHIIQVLGHEVRPLTESEFTTLQDKKFNEWLQAQREATTIEIDEIWREAVPEITLPTS